MSNTYIECIPDEYVGPYVSVTICCRQAHENNGSIQSLLRRIELDVDSLNAICKNKIKTP